MIQKWTQTIQGEGVSLEFRSRESNRSDNYRETSDNKVGNNKIPTKIKLTYLLIYARYCIVSRTF